MPGNQHFKEVGTNRVTAAEGSGKLNMFLGFGGTEVTCSQGGGRTMISRSESGVSQPDFSVKGSGGGGGMSKPVSIPFLIMSVIGILKDQLLLVV